MGLLTDCFVQQFVSPAAIASAPAQHDGSPPLLNHDTLAGADKKHIPATVCRSHVDSFGSAYRDFVHEYTDGSVDRLPGTATVACNMLT